MDKTQGSGNDAVDEIILTNFGFLNEDEFVTNASVSFYLSFDLKHYYDETKTNFVLFNVTLTNKSMNTALFNVIDSIVLSYDSTYDYKNQISSTLIRDSASIVGQFPSITTASIQSDFLHLKLILNFNVSTIDSFKQIYTDFLQNPLRLSLKIDLGSIAA